MKNENKGFVEKNQKKVIIAALAVVLLLGGTYAWLTLTLKGTKKVRVEAGTLSLVLNEENAIDVAEAVPMTDEEGLKTEAYTFSVQNDGNITSNYTIYLDDADVNEGDERLDDSIVKYSLVKNSDAAKTELLSATKNSGDERVLSVGTVDANAKDTYTLRLWIDESATNADVQTTTSGTPVGKVFAGKLRIEASQIKE